MLLDEVVDAHAEPPRLRDLAARVVAVEERNVASTLLPAIGERQAAAGDLDGAGRTIARIVALMGPDPEGWGLVWRDHMVWRVESRIREARGLPPMPPPPSAPPPSRREDPPAPRPDLVQAARQEAERERREALARVLDGFGWRYDLGFATEAERAAADRALDELLRRYSAPAELRRLGKEALDRKAYGQFHVAARVALALADAGDLEGARELQRRLAAPTVPWGTGNPPINDRRKGWALDLLEPRLGPVEREFPARGRDDATYELDVTEELAVVHPRRVAWTCRAAAMRLARGEWDAALSHVLDAFRRATSLGELTAPPDELADLDDVARRVLLAQRPLGEWRELLLAEETAETWDVPSRAYLLGWIAGEQARLGDVAEATLIRDGLAAMPVESYDDMQLDHHLGVRDGAVRRADEAIEAARRAGAAGEG